MKKLLSLLLSLLLCSLFLAACTGENAQDPLPSTPGDQTSLEAELPSGETSKESKPSAEAETPPEEPTPDDYALSPEILAEYADWFAAMDFNGLLRFPYDNGADWEQIMPYLGLLFYDIGETDISDEERTALEAAGMFLEVDEFRLSRTFVVDYLTTWLSMLPEDAEAMLNGAESFGIYLSETDAWYICHGDTAWMPYTFDRGVSLPDSETVKLYYTNPFLTVILEDGEETYLTDQPMVVTISIEGGERKVLSNEILSAPYN